MNESTKLWLLQAIYGEEEWAYLNTEGRLLALKVQEEAMENTNKNSLSIYNHQKGLV